MQLVSPVIQEFYEFLRSEPKLSWLAKNYKERSGSDPVEEWDKICAKIRGLSVWRHVIIIGIIFLSLIPVMVAVNMYKGQGASKSEIIMAKTAINVIGCIVIMPGLFIILNKFERLWTELATSWLHEKWTTKNFTDDVWNLCLTLGAEPGFSMKTIEDTLASREVDKEGEIPRHVFAQSHEALSGRVKKVLYRTDGVASAYVGVGDDRKEAKGSLDICKMFRIVPEDRPIGFYYREVEQGENQKGKNG